MGEGEGGEGVCGGEVRGVGGAVVDLCVSAALWWLCREFLLITP